MTRFTLALLAFSGALTLPLLDAAAKGTVVLVAAGLVCVILRRDSAATRHCVLSVAVAMLLLIPGLSLMLPQWRILPAWAVPNSMVATEQPTPPELAATTPNESTIRSGSNIQAFDAQRFADEIGATRDTFPDTSLSNPPMPIASDLPRPSLRDAAQPESSVGPNGPELLSSELWSLLPGIWLIGVVALAMRLVISAIQLRLSEFGCSDGSEFLRSDLARAMKSIGLKRPFRVCLDPNDSVPIVWGLFVPRLRLPAAALNWPKDQLHSVLLHELAHLRRFDLLELLLTQLACVMHWYNPLVWLVSRRLHAERERACDDLVLNSGVKASSYAEHLLHVSSHGSASNWSQVCGLAMARQSSLEGRLRAVLSINHQRRRASVLFLVVTIVLGACLSVPLAMLGGAMEVSQESDKPSSNEVENAVVTPAADETNPIEPTHDEAKSLFQEWKNHARTDGKIPGALIGQLAIQVDDFIKNYKNEEGVNQFVQIRPRLDSTRDWQPSEVALLLNEIAAINTAPIGWSSMSIRFDGFRTIQAGQPLPDNLGDVAWGPAAENGLRAAWLLEPNSSDPLDETKDDPSIRNYPLGSVLKVRVLFHNSGTAPVVFRTETWHQSDSLTVRDAQGAEIKTNGTFYTGITPLANYRLLPGQYCEVSAPGVAIGAGDYVDESSTGRLGVVIEAKAGDEVSFSCVVDAAQGITFSRAEDPNDQTELWKKQVAERVNSDAPLPQSSADRELLIRRAMLDLTGVAPTAEEVAQFVSDTSPQALDHLVERIQAIAPVEPWTGKLPTGITKFRVTETDPNAAKRPRVATSPGRYVLSESAHLLVTQVTAGSAPRKNSAQIAFLSQDPSVESPHKPFQIELPDGLGDYAMLWVRDSGQLQIVERGSVRTIDFSNPSSVSESRAKENLSPEFRALLPEELKETSPDAASSEGGEKLDPAIEAQLDWGEAVNGMRGALIIRPRDGNANESVFLVLQNVSDKPIHFRDTTKAERLNSLYVSEAREIMFAVSNDEPTMTDVVLAPREVTYLPLMQNADAEINAGFIDGIRKDALQTWRAVLRMSKLGEAEVWRGDLSTGDSRCEVRPALPQPKDEAAQALFKIFQANARLNGDIPGGLLHRLHDKVKEFIRNNEPDASGAPYAEKMKPLELRFANKGDWKAADVVALMDDIAVVTTIPLDTTREHIEQRTLQRGTPLPASLENADWGQPLESGLRMAFLLEPRLSGYHLGSEIKARILFHNSGSEPVAFVTTGFQQPHHVAKLADGTELQLESTEWLTLGIQESYRLAPGDYCEIFTPGLGIGTRNPGQDDWADVRAGSWIECAAGDEVVFTPGAATLYYDHDGQLHDWWLSFISERLNREAPIPTDKTEREYLLYRVVSELFGTAPSTTQGDAFAAVKSQEAISLLERLLLEHAYGKQSHGLIHAGTSKFRVLPPDADAATRPRIASNPGWYSLADNVKLSVTREPFSNTVRNTASIIYFQQGQENVVHNVRLPNGYGTWAAATMKDATELWIAEQGALRKYDFTNPLAPVETRYADEQLEKAPILQSLRTALTPFLNKSAADVPTPRKPAPPAAEAPRSPIPDPPPATDEVTAKSRTVVIAADGTIQLDNQARSLEELKSEVIGNPNEQFVIKAHQSAPYENLVHVIDSLQAAGTKNVLISTLNISKLTPEALLGTWRGEMNGEQIRFSFHRPPVEDTVQLDVYLGDATIGLIAELQVADDGQSISVNRARGGATTSFGTLRQTKEGELQFEPTAEVTSHSETAAIALVRDLDKASTDPKQAAARELFAIWKATANADGTIPGKFIGRLATEVQSYVDANPNLDSGMKLPLLLPRFITTRDWTLSEATRLLDDVAYYSSKPIGACVEKAKLPSDPS